MDFALDGYTVLTVSDTVKIWHAATGVCLDTLSGHTAHLLSGLHDATFSPDGRLVLTASDDSAVKSVERHDRTMFNDVFW